MSPASPARGPLCRGRGHSAATVPKNDFQTQTPNAATLATRVTAKERHLRACSKVPQPSHSCEPGVLGKGSRRHSPASPVGSENHD